MSNACDDTIRDQVRGRYEKIAVAGGEDGSCTPGCCGSASASTRIGYSPEELAGLPEGADMGLGCGNPQVLAALKPGETVLDLGCGGGFDCFLAARRVGAAGLVVGVDMTPEMVAKARANVRRGGFDNVQIRLGEIEHLPVADNCVDVILSNCVINLSPDKPQVFREARRVLKSGGRLAVSDVVAIAPLPREVKENMDQYAGCVAGAAEVPQIEAMLAAAGFTAVAVTVKPASREFIKDWFPGSGIEAFVRSADIAALKP